MAFPKSLQRPASAIMAALGIIPLLASAAQAAAPTMNKGDTTWMLISTCLVVVMTIPGLALFYGGLVRAKNVLSVLMQVLIIFSIVSILWVLYGYSLAFTTHMNSALSPFIGGFSKLMLSGVDIFSQTGTFSKETNIPELVYVTFQMTFACITPALIVGAFAERMKFSAVLLFMVLWFTFAYLPMAHMVWFWAGADAYTLAPDNFALVAKMAGADKAKQLLDALAAATTDDAKAAVLGEYGAIVNANNGYLFNLGALDFAGGTVVHINAGVAGLICAIVLGKRVGYGRDPMAPHNLTFVLTGVGLLLFGWYGFNAGSSLEANGLTALIILNTTLAASAAALAWTAGEWMFRGHPSLLGGASGMVAGLVAITPACGFVSPGAAIIIGLLAGYVCLWAVVVLKSKLGYDDALDVFGVHGVGGILGALLTGVFVNPAVGGTGAADFLSTGPTIATVPYNFGTQMYAQVVAVIVAIVWTAFVSFVALMICRATVGLRVKEQEEREGLDVVDHGERAYN